MFTSVVLDIDRECIVCLCDDCFKLWEGCVSIFIPLECFVIVSSVVDRAQQNKCTCQLEIVHT